MTSWVSTASLTLGQGPSPEKDMRDRGGGGRVNFSARADSRDAARKGAGRSAGARLSSPQPFEEAHASSSADYQPEM